MLDDVEARRFLLGQLPPAEQGRIEELAFENPQTFNFLESVEDDLIDEFIKGELSAIEEKQFNDHFLSLPDRRNNLRISRLLQQHFGTVPNLPWFKRQRTWVAVLAALALVIFAVWIFNRIWESRKPVPVQAGSDRPATTPSPSFKVSPSLESAQTPAQVENKPKISPEKQRRSTSLAVLSPSAVPRQIGEGVQQLTLAPDSLTITVELALINRKNFQVYEAELKKGETVLQQWPNLKAERLTSGKALKIEVPASLLKQQDLYVIVVNGASAKGKKELVASYPFQVKEGLR